MKCYLFKNGLHKSGPFKVLPRTKRDRLGVDRVVSKVLRESGKGVLTVFPLRGLTADSLFHNTESL
jgi:hypothetical protein